MVYPTLEIKGYKCTRQYTWNTLLLCPLSYHNCGSLVFFIQFHIATLQSSLPEAMRSPCSLKFNELTHPSWKFSFDFSSSLSTRSLDAFALSLYSVEDSSPIDLLKVSDNGFQREFLGQFELERRIVVSINKTRFIWAVLMQSRVPLHESLQYNENETASRVCNSKKNFFSQLSPKLRGSISWLYKF